MGTVGGMGELESEWVSGWVRESANQNTRELAGDTEGVGKEARRVSGQVLDSHPQRSPPFPGP